MVIRFALDPEASDDMNARRARAARRLEMYGVLAAESAEGVAELLRRFNSGPRSEFGQVLVELVKRRTPVYPSGSPPVPLDDVWDGDGVESWQEVADLLVFSHARAEALEGEHVPSSPEICALGDVSDSEALVRTEELWKERVYPEGTERGEVWATMFKPFALHATQVYLVDAYAGKALAKRLIHKDFGDGAQWFLQRLAATKVRKISLVTNERELPSSTGQAEVEAAVHSWFRGLNSGTELEFVLSRAPFVHGRRFAFDGWVGFSVDAGLQTFDRPRLSEQLDLTAKVSLVDGVKSEYRTLSRARS